MKKRMISAGINLGAVALLYGICMLLMQTGVVNRYYQTILINMCINIILAVSLNLVTGFLGQLVLGHAGFMSVGGYAAALFTLYSGLPEPIVFPVSLLVGMLAAAIFGVVIGIPALRLKGDYLAIITLGFGEIIRVVILALGFTGGAKGLSGIPNLTSFTWVFAMMAAVVFLCVTLIRSRHGRAMISIREDEIAAQASGINTTYYKMLGFVLSAALAGLAGGLYAHNIGILTASKFDFNYSIEILVMVVLGGMGSITGSVVAAVILTILPEALRSFSDYRMVLYSVVLILMMLFKPSGLLGEFEFSIAGIYKKIKALIAKSKRGKEGE